MIFALAAREGEEIPTVVWNLVDWINQSKLSTANARGIMILCGVALCIFSAYLLGSINPAILISRLRFHDDIRKHGSGNAGTTNMLRTYGKKAALATLLCDLGKAAVAVLLGRLIWGVNGAALSGFFVMFGHMFPVFSHFRGGKGVACLAMVALMLSPITFVILLAMFLVIAIGTRYVSLASVMCAMLYPLILRAFANNGLNVAMAVLAALFVVIMHRENLKRLWNGTESKLDLSKFKKGKTDPPSDA